MTLQLIVGGKGTPCAAPAIPPPTHTPLGDINTSYGDFRLDFPGDEERAARHSINRLMHQIILGYYGLPTVSQILLLEGIRASGYIPNAVIDYRIKVLKREKAFPPPEAYNYPPRWHHDRDLDLIWRREIPLPGQSFNHATYHLNDPERFKRDTVRDITWHIQWTTEMLASWDSHGTNLYPEYEPLFNIYRRHLTMLKDMRLDKLRRRKKKGQAK